MLALKSMDRDVVSFCKLVKIISAGLISRNRQRLVQIFDILVAGTVVQSTATTYLPLTKVKTLFDGALYKQVEMT